VFRSYCQIVSIDWTHNKKKEAAEAVDAVEEIMENEPKASFRHLSQQVNFSVGTCRTILKKDLYLCPYRMTSVPELLVGDPGQRLQLCERFLNTSQNDDASLNKTFY
jgi:hypothetical protein